MGGGTRGAEPTSRNRQLHHRTSPAHERGARPRSGRRLREHRPEKAQIRAQLALARRRGHIVYVRKPDPGVLIRSRAQDPVPVLNPPHTEYCGGLCRRSRARVGLPVRSSAGRGFPGPSGFCGPAAGLVWLRRIRSGVIAHHIGTFSLWHQLRRWSNVRIEASWHPPSSVNAASEPVHGGHRPFLGGDPRVSFINCSRSAFDVGNDLLPLRKFIAVNSRPWHTVSS